MQFLEDFFWCDCFSKIFDRSRRIVFQMLKSPTFLQRLKRFSPITNSTEILAPNNLNTNSLFEIDPSVWSRLWSQTHSRTL